MPWVDWREAILPSFNSLYDRHRLFSVVSC